MAENNVAGKRDAGSSSATTVQRDRVLLADDNPFILSLVRDLLSSQFKVVGAFSNGEDVLRELPILNPDFVVLDISLGDPDGIEVARQISQMWSHIRIVFLTVHENSEFIRSALEVGGAGYVFKSRLSSDLITAIHAARDGHVFISCPHCRGDAGP